LLRYHRRINSKIRSKPFKDMADIMGVLEIMVSLREKYYLKVK